MSTTIAPGHWLRDDAAASYQRMRAAGLPAGGITDAGRTRAEQEALYARYLRGELVAYAARPGTSKHETGCALDLDGAARAWVRQHGTRFGWLRDQVRNEPWHMEYVPALDLEASRITPPTAAQEDDPMPTPQEIAAAVWSHPSPDRPGVTMGQELADIKTKLTRWETTRLVAPDQLTTQSTVDGVPVLDAIGHIKTKVTRIEDKTTDRTTEE